MILHSESFGGREIGETTQIREGAEIWPHWLRSTTSRFAPCALRRSAPSLGGRQKIPIFLELWALWTNPL